MKRIKTKQRKLYRVFCNEICYLGTQYVWADNEAEAKENYAELWERGFIEVNDSNLSHYDTKIVIEGETPQDTLIHAEEDANRNETIINHTL